MEKINNLIWEEDLVDFLGYYWTMKGRPDLFSDVVDHVLSVYPNQVDTAETLNELMLVAEAFIYLQTLCRDAVSSQDLEYMAVAEKERMIFTP